MKYRKKSVVVEAFQYWNDARPNWFDDAVTANKIITYKLEPVMRSFCLIKTLEGEMRADYMDWIIRGVKGEIYPCKPDIFEATYEPAESPSTAEQGEEK